MKVFHDSRDIRYRTPYGAIEAGASVDLALDVQGAPDASVALRVWSEDEGERIFEMAAAEGEPEGGADGGAGEVPTRYRAAFTPERPGTYWYHFIVKHADGTEKRYGACDGRFGGAGQLRDYEPPSFQLTAYDPEAQACDLDDRPTTTAIMRFLRNETRACDLAEAVEAWRENASPQALEHAYRLLGGRTSKQLLVELSGAAPLGSLSPEQCAALELEDWQSNQAKGRLWCASVIDLLVVGNVSLYDQAADANPHDKRAAFPSAFPDDGADADCEDIVRNAWDAYHMLPLFEEGALTCFSVGDDVFGFWRVAADGSAACVLMNASPSDWRSVDVPAISDSFSEFVEGRDIETITAESADRARIAPTPQEAEAAQGYVRMWLHQLGTAMLYFHPSERFARPLEPGVGVLAHITSLPTGDPESPEAWQHPGTLGAPSLRFVDWLAEANVRYWQVLPVNPTDDCGSPYAGISAFAGNVRLLEGYYDGDAKAAAGGEGSPQAAAATSSAAAELAAAEAACEGTFDEAAFAAFRQRERSWLDSYAAYMAIRQKLGDNAPWQQWPEEYRRYDPAIIEADPELRSLAERWSHVQFAFDQQWRELRTYANERGVLIVGDMPIYVSADSADVWAHPELFQLDGEGQPAMIAGCPPDQFSADGQIWGNPVYDWDALEASGYDWWMRRLKRAFDLYDLVRLDHFIGFARYFSIPAGGTALQGSYQPGPGLEFFSEAFDEFGPLPIIAEDLGTITPAVRALVDACGFYGMDIAQFVDGNDPLAGYQPRPGKIAYTGTHDNQTIAGYAKSRYPDLDAAEVASALAEAVISCSAPVRILPLQDIIGLDDEARMNVPGTAEGNWTWRADLADVRRAQERMAHLVQLGDWA